MITKLIEKKDFEYFFKNFKKDFPFAERRNKKDSKNIFKNPHYCAEFIIENNLNIGYICYWNFDDFIFIEHFAILEEFRNNGKGSFFLQYFKSSKCKNIIFEIEPPTRGIKKRRYEFYKRNGFYMLNIDYFQPSYHKNGKPFKLSLMTNNNNLTTNTIETYVKIIKKEVYNQ